MKFLWYYLYFLISYLHQVLSYSTTFKKEAIISLQKLIEENAQLDKEISKISNQSEGSKIEESPHFLQLSTNITPQIGNGSSTSNKGIQCWYKEGMLKFRDSDQSEKEIPVSYAMLTHSRLNYFVNPKDETSIQGSIELNMIKDNLKMVNGFPSCFTIKTIDEVTDCTVCAENSERAFEWINAITQNSVNCVENK